MEPDPCLLFKPAGVPRSGFVAMCLLLASNKPHGIETSAVHPPRLGEEFGFVLTEALMDTAEPKGETGSPSGAAGTSPFCC